MEIVVLMPDYRILQVLIHFTLFPIVTFYLQNQNAHDEYESGFTVLYGQQKNQNLDGKGNLFYLVNKKNAKF